MKIVGYADRFSVRQDESIRFMVSCQTPTYHAQLVSLIHGDPNPAGPGFKEQELAAACNDTYTGREQEIYKGSYCFIPGDNRFSPITGLTLQLWLWSTTPTAGKQGLITRLPDEGAGYALYITDRGDVAFELRDGTGGSTSLCRTEVPLRDHTWYFIACTYDQTRSEIQLIQEPVRVWPIAYDGTHVRTSASFQARPDDRSPLLLGARCTNDDPLPRNVCWHFNGKLDRPRLFDRALNETELASLRNNPNSEACPPGMVAGWDFSVDVASSTIADVSANQLHGTVVNAPQRAVTGYNWTGRETDYRNAPEEYGAIYFHDDDLDDARWDCDFEFNVPTELTSGVYAIRLTTGEHFDYVPFFVRPAGGRAQSKILFLAPTLSYMAYGNEHLPSRPGRTEKLMGLNFGEFLSLGTEYEQACYLYMHDNNLTSLYDFHSDGSGVAYTTRLRPITNFRPLYNKPVLRFKGPHQFNEDLYLVDWLTELGYEFDIATDEDLHFEGIDLLSQYNVILTGSHPEYWTLQMLDALENYLNSGGRLMYLGGNGFYWVTSFDPQRPHLIEVRRAEAGVRTWQAEPGEYHHSTTGELGGLWRYRGKIPQRIVGNGMTATGGEPARPYRRQEDSLSERVRFMFEGIGEREILGDFGLHLGGAAGWELDRADTMLGTPPHALVVASSFGHSDVYQLSVEELWKTDPNVGGTQCRDVRADIVYFEYPNGGAVFSVGSISYCGSLSFNGYKSNISQLTDNVLKAFMDETQSAQ